jgi:Ni,Fe-hydrogenase I cytochrome b subunit
VKLATQVCLDERTNYYFTRHEACVMVIKNKHTYVIQEYVYLIFNRLKYILITNFLLRIYFHDTEGVPVKCFQE